MDIKVKMQLIIKYKLTKRDKGEMKFIMKTKFPQYHIKEYTEDIIKNAVIILDTNALLNLYRYNKENRQKYFEILEKISNRIVLPYHVCEEFYKNKNTLIKNRADFKNNITNLIREHFENITHKIKSGVDSSLSILKNEDIFREKIIENLEKSKEDILNLIEEFKEDITDEYIYREDPILNNIVEIFTDKVSDKIPEEKLKEIYKEGEQRYKNQIPPGYKDEKKGYPDKFGDLIVWNEIIEIAKKLDKDVLLVSDDRKEDWVEKYKGIDLGARKELTSEFIRLTNKRFLSVTTKDFIKRISDVCGVEDTESLQSETERIQEQIRKEDDEKMNLIETSQTISDISDIVKQQKGLAEVLTASSGLAGFMEQQKGLTEAVKTISGISDIVKQQKGLAEVLTASSGLAGFMEQQKGLTEAVKTISGISDIVKQQKGLAGVLTASSGLARIVEQQKRLEESFASSGIANIAKQQQGLLATFGACSHLKDTENMHGILSCDQKINNKEKE